MDNKVVVKIFGEEYPITGGDDPAYISKVADCVDARMHDVAERSRSQARDKVAILAALSLASELQEKSDHVSRVLSDQDKRLGAVISRLDEVLAGTPVSTDDQPSD
ncbi:MAG: cell division protein ZapA [candidate division Zixibacteria bacterium]|nr:cell division protein ZapA [candidate division Zixibacteria bacterium]